MKKILFALALLPLTVTAQTTADELNSTGDFLKIGKEGISLNDGSFSITVGANGVQLKDGTSHLTVRAEDGLQRIINGDILNINKNLIIPGDGNTSKYGDIEISANIPKATSSKRRKQNIYTRAAGKKFTNDELVGQDLRGRDFSNAEFTNTNFFNVDLSGANLTGADFTNVEITGSKFVGANLSGAEFTNTDITDTNMTNAVFTNICFWNTDITDSSMARVDFSGSVMGNTDFINVDLTGANRDYILPRRSRCRDIDHTKYSTPLKTTQRPKVTSAKEIVSKLSQQSGSIDLTVNFMTNSDQLFGEAHAQVAEIAKAVSNQKLKGKNIQIQGHTDSDGSDNHNYDLSYRRATTVQRALTQDYGVDFNQLSIKGFGESKPIADNNDAYGRAYNRRVTLVVM